MMLIDSHCHLDRLSYGSKQAKNMAGVLAAAKAVGVEYLLCVGTTQAQFVTMMQAIAPHPQIFASAGVHPLNQETGIDRELFLKQAAEARVVAIGETGLDFFYAAETRQAQEEAFRLHIQVAKALNKPLIIHTREAREETLAILRSEGAEQVGGVIHCFTEDWPMAKALLEMGFYISISGIATFKNAKALQEVVKQIPLDRLLVETDAPYLTPIPHRGVENEPAFVRDVAQFVADLHHRPLIELAEITSANFWRCFPQAKALAFGG